MAQNPPTWTEADKIALRTYVAANPNFITELLKRLPRIEGATVEQRAMTGSDVKGFLDCIDEINGMQTDGQSVDDPGFIDERTPR